MRKKDVVLMATVTSFEALERPSRSELHQFAELFRPLFAASSDEARRQAVAALSQCRNVPSAVAFFIASQPIAIAAPFIASSACLDDETLIAIARTQGGAHARAIVRREVLSPTVIDALVGLRHAADTRPTADRMSGEDTEARHPAADGDATSQDSRRDVEAQTGRDEALRQRLLAMAAHIVRPESDRLGMRTVTPMQTALLVRFARNRETGFLATTLADALSASRWLAERIMLDISGQQLATTLKGMGMPRSEGLYVLERLYQHLEEPQGNALRSQVLWDMLDVDECGRRVEAWGRADRYTYEHGKEAATAETPASSDMASAVRRTTASNRSPLRSASRGR